MDAPQRSLQEEEDALTKSILKETRLEDPKTPITKKTHGASHGGSASQIDSYNEIDIGERESDNDDHEKYVSFSSSFNYSSNKTTNPDSKVADY